MMTGHTGEMDSDTSQLADVSWEMANELQLQNKLASSSRFLSGLTAPFPWQFTACVSWYRL